MLHRWSTARALLAMILLPATVAAGEFTLTASAGLDGVAKPGRWAPVHVTLNNRDRDVTGELIVEWGRSVVTRAIEVPAPSTKKYELYVRTGDARDVIVVRIRANGRDLISREVPIRIAGLDDELTASAAAIPRSWRGLDAATAIAGVEGATLTAEQRQAIAQWTTSRRMETVGAGAASGTIPSAAPASGHVTPTLFMYLVAIGTVSAFPRQRWLKAGGRVAAILAVTALGAAAVVGQGRGTPIVVRHASIARQMAGASDSSITMRAAADFPAFDMFALHPTLSDAAIDTPARVDNRFHTTIDVDGNPTIYGVFALGATQPFTLEATTSWHVFELEQHDATVRVVNRSPHTLHDCDFPRAFGAPLPLALAPGEGMQARVPIEPDDAVVTCVIDAAPIDIVDTRRPVDMRGTTAVVYYLNAGDDSR